MASSNSGGASPMRATYVNLYPPESDAEFVRSVAAARSHENSPRHQQLAKVVDSYSCRQMYLKSYTFTKKESSAQEKAKQCMEKVKESAQEKAKQCMEKVKESANEKRKTCKAKVDRLTSKVTHQVARGRRKAVSFSCLALFSNFRRLLLCSSVIDKVPQQHWKDF